MFVQKGILKYESNVESLFVHKDGQTQSFDTFFNSLNLYLIKHYTDGKHLTIEFDYDGNPSVKIFFSCGNEHRVLFETAENTKTIAINLENLPEKGMIYPVIAGDSNLRSFVYKVDATSHKVSTGIAITTYNRQDFLFPNLYKLAECENIDKVIVIDNARNITLPNDLDNKRFVVIPNKNLGGSGGFTRGMIEARDLGLSHVFLMDDDIVLIPEIIDKAISFVSCLKEEHSNDWLGFSILTFDHPTVQHELGAKWNGRRLKSNNKNFDLSFYNNVDKNQIIAKYHYSGWWSLIMPTSVIKDYGCPLPFFIKFDDIEYGLRRNNEEIILSNGFGVWHEDFAKKAVRKPYIEYYNSRNPLITNAIHKKHGCFHSTIRYLEKCLKFYLKRQYIELRMTHLGINDFLKGPNYFLMLDIENKNGKLREIEKHQISLLKGIFIYPFICLHYYFKLLFKFNKAKKQYLTKYGELISENYWCGAFQND